MGFDLNGMSGVERLSLMEQLLVAEIEGIAEEAQGMSDVFWAHREGLVEIKTGEGMYPVLGCRVQRKENSVSMSWFYYRFFKPKGSSNARRVNIHIRKPKKGNGYSISTLLKYATPEQEGMVRAVEGAFEGLRYRMEVIRKLKHNLHYYKKACGIVSEEDEKINEGV
ncbi:MAG: hypothetical protein IE914_05190 [Thiotrichales bacterium]|nr:hypothetical protein [Thiotrichales bacterium]